MLSCPVADTSTVAVSRPQVVLDLVLRGEAGGPARVGGEGEGVEG
ncbi:MAG: hypothetical protein ACRDSR_10975 [Pseudonocardiaceae bacterium]